MIIIPFIIDLNTEVNMKIKFYALLVLSGLLMAACAPAAVMEPEPSPVVVVVEAKPTTAPAPTDTVAPTEEVMTADVSFSKDIWPVVEQFALPTHGGRGGVFLESYNDILKYVVPGKPEESVLMDALTGTNGHPVMPPGNPFPQATIQLFYDWILQGAKNN
jgi:hypothetical protein